jgi:hypothetical protein
MGTQKGLFLNFSITLYLFFINNNGTQTFSRLSGITVKNFSQIGSIVSSVTMVIKKTPYNFTWFTWYVEIAQKSFY